MRIKEVVKSLDEVAPGGVFKLTGMFAKSLYVKTDRERAGTVTVVRLGTGEMHNLYLSLPVVEIEQ